MPSILLKTLTFSEAVKFLLAFRVLFMEMLIFEKKRNLRGDLIQNISNFTVEETEALRGQMICLKLYN